MKHVTSSDGTSIAYERRGSGPPLLIIGGALADHAFYAPLACELEAHFTVVNFDRRGRGGSGNTLPYLVRREIEDVMTLIGLDRPPAFVYGHSAGAALALQAAAADAHIAHLVLADPPYSPRGGDEEGARADFAAESAKIALLQQRGDARGCARLFLASMGVPDAAIDEWLDSPGGDSILRSARVLSHDYELLGDSLVPDAIACRVATQTTILVTDATHEAATQLAASIPNARIVRRLHAAHETDPVELAKTLVKILLTR